ncbi:hypothetical protein YUBABA_00200 [Serratia phage vB_SmaM-Yubaba]|nr:hypothetical protein YUBABA_00200 [Serratia phage vB_SmaM-Yubaba]
MDGVEEFEDFLAANPDSSYAEIQSKMEEIISISGEENRTELEEMIDEHFEDYQSTPEDFE